MSEGLCGFCENGGFASCQALRQIKAAIRDLERAHSETAIDDVMLSVHGTTALFRDVAEDNECPFTDSFPTLSEE